ncbi:MAG: hypothetical protein BJ554DRAFT_5932 [Olpidium bornovanus]|uniref:CBS domain-containing protein n=1 Tax=Olpidium bornovanus TaxID=278681 RepID=A0A8H7ZYD2_9FUNG|nr:MAG: hypothetical protein BJ554DRAFT_5932 [Olpidium bornovanus]
MARVDSNVHLAADHLAHFEDARPHPRRVPRYFFYRRQELKELVTLHSEETNPGGLTKGEVSIIHGALSLPSRKCQVSLAPLDKVFMLSSDDKLDRETMNRIWEKGYSRIPIHEPDIRDQVIGVLHARAKSSEFRQNSPAKLSTFADARRSHPACLPLFRLPVKRLILVDPDDAVKISDLSFHGIPYVYHDFGLADALNVFQQGVQPHSPRLQGAHARAPT